MTDSLLLVYCVSANVRNPTPPANFANHVDLAQGNGSSTWTYPISDVNILYSVERTAISRELPSAPPTILGSQNGYPLPFFFSIVLDESEKTMF